jgi:hypothetical protein
LSFQLLLKSLGRPRFQKAAAALRHPVPEACEIARRSPVLLSEGTVGLERRGLSVQGLLTGPGTIARGAVLNPKRSSLTQIARNCYYFVLYALSRIFLIEVFSRNEQHSS